MTPKQKLTWAWIRARWDVLDFRANLASSWCSFVLKFMSKPNGQNGILDKIASVSVDHFSELVNRKGKLAEESTAFVDTLKK